MEVRWHKKRNGPWVLLGPVKLLTSAAQHRTIITVTRGNGTHDRRIIERVGQSFPTPNGEMVYGYLPTGPCDNCDNGIGNIPAHDGIGVAGLICRKCYDTTEPMDREFG